MKTLKDGVGSFLKFLLMIFPFCVAILIHVTPNTSTGVNLIAFLMTFCGAWFCGAVTEKSRMKKWFEKRADMIKKKTKEDK